MSDEQLSPPTLPLTEARAARRSEAAARLKTIEGQIRALRRMVRDGEGCLAIATQGAAALEGLRAALRVVLRNYMDECLGFEGDVVEQDAAYDHFINVVERFIR